MDITIYPPWKKKTIIISNFVDFPVYPHRSHDEFITQYWTGDRQAGGPLLAIAVSAGLPLQGQSLSLPASCPSYPSPFTLSISGQRKGQFQLGGRRKRPDGYLTWFLIDYCMITIRWFIFLWRCHIIYNCKQDDTPFVIESVRLCSRKLPKVFCYLGDVWSREWMSPGSLAEMQRCHQHMCKYYMLCAHMLVCVCEWNWLLEVGITF